MATNPFGYSNAQSNPWDQDPEYDKSRYQYGGYAGGANDERTRLGMSEADVEQRQAPQMTGAQLDQNPANESRDFQMGSLADLHAAATGNAPSSAEILARQGADRLARSQVSAAGTVRGGPGAQASAFRAVSQGAAQQGADLNQSIQANRANEMASARGQLASAATGARGEDLSAATTNANLAQDTSKTNAGFDLQGRALNDARAQQYEGLQNKVASDQLDANLQQQQIAAGVRQHGDTLNTQTNQKNADRTWDVTKGVVGLAQGAAGGVAKLFTGSDENMKEPVGGSLAGLGLGGAPGGHGHGVGGGIELGPSGSISHEDLLAAGSGLGGPQAVPGMVGGGGITGGHVDTGEDGSMMSDEETKTPSPSFSDWLGRSAKGAPEDGKTPDGGAITSGGPPVKEENGVLSSILTGIAGAKPYDRDPEVAKGVAGAPRGYANGRGAPEEDKVSWAKPETWGLRSKKKDQPSTEGQAPGQDDWQRYGAPETTKTKTAADGSTYVSAERAKEGETDWNNGGAIAKPDAQPGVFEALFGGLANARPFGEAQRDVTTSDPAAKRAAYVQGRADGSQTARSGEPVPYAVGAPLAHDEELVQKKDGTPEVRKKPGGKAPEKKAEELPTSAMLDRDYESMKPKARPASPPVVPVPSTPGMFDRDTANFAPQARSAPPIASKEDWLAYTGSDERMKHDFEGVSDREMADAMRSMKPAVYAYKGKYTPADQSPGEVNIGPMANAMASNPVARTAIVRDGESGLLAIDKTKAEKLIMGSLAALQHQVDELDSSAPRTKKRGADGRRAVAR